MWNCLYCNKTNPRVVAKILTLLISLTLDFHLPILVLNNLSTNLYKLLEKKMRLYPIM